MNARRRCKYLQPSSDEAKPRGRTSTPAGGKSRKRVPKTENAAWLFADFLAACMTLPADKLDTLE